MKLHTSKTITKANFKRKKNKTLKPSSSYRIMLTSIESKNFCKQTSSCQLLQITKKTEGTSKLKKCEGDNIRGDIQVF